MPATQDPQYYVYTLTNRTRTLYVGVTNDLERRVYQHRNKLVPGFTSKYNVTRLAYYEQTSDVESAIVREKQVKSRADLRRGVGNSAGEAGALKSRRMGRSG